MHRKVNPLLVIIFMHAASNCNARQIFSAMSIFDPYIVCKSIYNYTMQKNTLVDSMHAAASGRVY